MIAKTVATAAHLTAAAALMFGLCAVSVSEQASASTPAAVAVGPATFVLTGAVGMGGNTGSPLTIAAGTVGVGGNVSA